MVNRNLLRQFDLPQEELQQELADAFNLPDYDENHYWLSDENKEFNANKVVEGKVVLITGDQVVVDVGYKSEGVIPLDEWKEDGTQQLTPPKIGEAIKVLLESVEDESGAIVLSYRKAKRQEEWESVVSKHKEGDTVSGPVTRKIKGGLLVNIGVNVFLPASQVDIRRPADIGEYIGRTIQCKILTIDEFRRNIVVSRRKLIEDERAEKKAKLLSELAPGQLRKGVVKNIADFGAFVDLGGMDGLLHITDMSWGRVADAKEVVKIDQELEVYVLNVDREREKIALSLKHKTASPWQNVEGRYPVGSKQRGEVVNVMTYGAFVKLEPGVEGLVHISEMSWTKRISHPNEVVSIGDVIDVQVLAINHEKHEISLGMKQVMANPWDIVAGKYTPGTLVEGTVRNLTNYGAFVEIEDGIDGLLHVSDLSWVRKIGHPSDLLTKGDKVKCVVLSVDQERKRIALGLKQMASDPWEGDIPGRYMPGDVKTGKVTKLTNFGVFVELEPGLEGLLHISELADQKVGSPEDVVKVGDAIEVKILRVDVEERKIGLSRKRVGGEGEEDDTVEEAPISGTPAKPRDLRGGTGRAKGDLISMPEQRKD